jgi:hypothetical protein
METDVGTENETKTSDHSSDLKLFEILVPTIYGDTNRPISTAHHREWDKVIRKISGGLTILTPAKGQWIHEHNVYEERVIPVRIMCTEKDMEKIVPFTLKHYRQKAVMYYVLSNECRISYAKGTEAYS